MWPDIEFIDDDGNTIQQQKLKLEKENIVQVKTFESLLTAQEELKKPILYFAEKEANHFILNDETEMLIFTMKLNEEESEFEKEIQKYLETKNKKNKKKKRILNDLDNTTIIKLEDDKFYKISPMKNKNKK